MISVRLELQRRNKENGLLKKCEPEVMTCEYHTEDQQKLQEFESISRQLH